ncbi:hypothetical protein [Coleofasciculus sp. FACHB-1120]|uniref:hypothetical protein n=1 Tax=Coleofasciculus sp. FACHB-1120 TaxID=2692783 RepID=UPI0016867865|nr:hypothetical protein [Coleofasciculus sp. FACHB-1120]MBD2743419.1 hypothetical protein [Coleofasciculus sp. FACHB-1120]
MCVNIPREKQIVVYANPLFLKEVEVARAFTKPNPDGARALEPLPCGFSLLRSEFHLPFSQKSDALSPQLGQLSG